MIDKKVVITILGTAGCRFDKDENRYVVGSKALYTADVDVSINGGEFYNTLPMILKNYPEDKYDVIAIHTKEAKQAQKEVLKAEKLDYSFDSRFFIKDFNNNKDIFSIINRALAEYQEVVFDISHGFRHLPILATIGMIVENIKSHNKIKQILFAQEVKAFKEYKIVNLKEYLDIANISFAIESFLNMYKVPDLSLEHELYKNIKEFSILLTTNQYHDMFQKSIPTLLKSIEEHKEELYFIDKQLDELNKMLHRIKSIQAKQTYEKFLFFAEIFLEKDYFLLSSTYMIEAISLYVGEIFSRLDIMNFKEKYEYQSKIVNFLKGNVDDKNFKLPHKYFYDINSEVFKKFSSIRDKIADIRHNLVHINTSKSFDEIGDELEKALENTRKLINNRELENLDFSDEKKTTTLTYKKEQVDLDIKILYNKHQQQNKPKLEKLWYRYNNNELHKVVTNKNLKNDIEKYFRKNNDYLKSILDKY